MHKEIQTWLNLNRQLREIKNREQEARQTALWAALEEGQSGRLGVFEDAQVTLRFKTIKPASERMKEIEEEISYLRTTADERLRTNQTYQQLKLEVTSLAKQLQAKQAELDALILDPDLLAELEYEKSRHAGEKQPEIVVRFDHA